jgi:hypothetical protein
MKRILNKIMVTGTIMVCIAFGARPFGTDDAGTVSPAGYELELGYDLWSEIGSLGIGFKHGLTEKMDIGIGFGFNLLTEPKNSFTPSELCLKYALLPDFLATSFTAEIGGSSYALNGILTRCFGPVEFDANLGYVTGDSSITYAGAIIYSIGNFALGGEVLGDKETKSFLVGGRYTIKEGLMVDAGFTGDFHVQQKNATCGIHYEF